MHSMGERVRFEGELLPAVKLLEAQKLSVHDVIQPDGTVIACVGVDREAYHAGKSVFTFPGDPASELHDLNRSFLGCEMLVAGDHDYGSFLRAIQATDCYTEAQYRSAGWLYAGWLAAFGFPRTHVVAHSAVSGDDVRGEGNGKQDPGRGWQWERLWGWVDTWETEFATAQVSA